MRNMLALFAAALLTVVGAGWYLGWYKVRNQAASVPGQHSVNIDIDTHKISSDLHHGEEKIQQMLENQAKEEAKKVPDAKKTADSLTLPSPLPSPQANQGDKGPTFHLGIGEKGPVLQFGGPDKGAFLQIGVPQK